MESTKQSTPSGSKKAKGGNALRMQAAVDNAMTAMMMIDRDFVITYANRATMDLLKKHEGALAAAYPGFKADNFIGTCIDIFHKNPAHQRQVLATTDNLPYQTDIRVGDLKFALNVTAIVDTEGNYIGNSLEWSDVTELRYHELQIARMEAAIGNAMTAMMMIDRDFVITYANRATLDLLKKHESALAAAYPGFKADNFIGTCIDMFHKNPAHQRQLLATTESLPYQTDIRVGDLQFALNVTAIVDVKGNYIGNALEWSDVSELRKKEAMNADYSAQIDAISKSQAVIEFNMDGTIIKANDNFLNTVGYRWNEIQGQHHRMFVEPTYGNSVEYRQFWEKLNRGEYDAAEYMRIGKGGKEVWIKASYNPIFDVNGKAFKVVKYATDITEQKNAEVQIARMISLAAQGDLSERIAAEQYSGSFKKLGEDINKLMDTVVGPIDETTRVMQAMAEGNLSDRMNGEYLGQFAVLSESVNSTLNNMTEMVDKIRSSSSNMLSAATEISQGNQDLSQRTEEQASSLEETASSMEQLTGTVRQNADNAKQANQLAAGARGQAEQGGDVVGNAISAMSEINSSSKKIADIIGVIDEIAFQTNLLALNAAVEAARAGEQGRGFAVVAAEVRNLAQRSAAAAKEIKGLIKDSVEKVDDGSRLVNESGETLKEIVTAVKKVSDIIAEIAAASEEQSSGIEQVNKAVSQMDEVTQQNAALVEQAAAASESLDEQARGMDELMTFFNTGTAQQGARPVSHSPRPAAPAAGFQQQRRPAATLRAKPQPVAVATGGADDWEEF